MKKIYFIILMFFCFLGLMVKKVEALPALVTSDQFQINPSATWNQGYPSIACSSKESKCLVVWRDMRNDLNSESDTDEMFYGANSNADIYGRFISSVGSFGDFVIATDPVSALVKVDQARPEVVYNSTRNEFFVAWNEADPKATDKTNNNNFCQQGGYNIYGRRISTTGDFLGDKIIISEAEDCQWMPRIAYNQDQDNYLVIWHDFRPRTLGNVSLGKEIYGQIVNGDGTLFEDNFQLSKNASGGAPRYQEYSTVTYNPDQKSFLAVWMDDRETVGETRLHDLWGTEVTVANDSITVDVNFRIFKDSGVSRYPEVAYDPKNKEYVLVWSETQADGKSVAKMLRLTFGGTVVGQALNLNTAIGHPAYPAVGVNPESGQRLLGYEHGNTIFVGFSQTEAITEKVVSSPWTYARPPIDFDKTGQMFFGVYTGSANGHTRLYWRRFELAGSYALVATPTLVPGSTPVPAATLPPENRWAGTTFFDNPWQGVFQCHADNKVGTDYLKGGSVIINWKDFQPVNNDTLDQTAVANLVNTLKKNKKRYLHFAIYQENKAAEEIYPGWLRITDSDRTNDVIGVVYDGVFPQPWDSRYQEKLGKFLTLLSTALRSAGVMDKIEYIEPAAGGMWTTTHLYISDNRLSIWAQAAGCGATDWSCLGRKFNIGVNAVLEKYLAAFPDKALMVIGGSCGIGHGDACNYNINPILEKYGMRIMIKAAGLGAPDGSCGLRVSSLAPRCSGENPKTKCAQEQSGPSKECCGKKDPVTGEILPCCGDGFCFDLDWGCGYHNTYLRSLKDEKVSYYCLYTKEIGCREQQNGKSIDDINREVAGWVGSQITLVSATVDSHEKQVGGNLKIDFAWRNDGSVALTAPLKQGIKWVPSSYKLFLEFVMDGRVAVYQEYSINPGTNTWVPVNLSKEAISTLQANLPAGLGGAEDSSRTNYRVYAGLTDPSGESQRFALRNTGSNYDAANRRLLIADSFTVIGKATAPVVTIQPTMTINPTAMKVLGDANGDGQVDGADFFIWVGEMMEYRWGSGGGGRRADFNNDNGVNVQDFVIWRREAMK